MEDIGRRLDVDLDAALATVVQKAPLGVRTERRFFGTVGFKLGLPPARSFFLSL